MAVADSGRPNDLWCAATCLMRTTFPPCPDSTTDNRVLTAAQTIAYHNDLLWGFGSEDGFGGGQHVIEVRTSDEIHFAV